MRPIASYVFMHLETTGLPSLESNATRITELSMVVLKRIHMEPNPSGQLPRVIQKLLMAFNPNHNISEGAAKLSGLNSHLLEREKIFTEKNVSSTIISFLESQEKPVCLIAHNGHRFGFPLLKNHFEFLKVWYGNVLLPEDLMCIDSRHCFYDLFNNRLVLLEFDRVISEREKNLNEVLASQYYNIDVSEEEYSLNSIYNRVLNVYSGDGLDYHTAESRSVMLAKIAIARASDFVKWTDNMYCPFSNVVALPRPPFLQ